LVLTTEALAKEPGPLTVTVDSAAAVESLKRVLNRQKRQVEIVELDGATIFNIGAQ
jgi:hypothetical protein